MSNPIATLRDHDWVAEIHTDGGPIIISVEKESDTEAQCWLHDRRVGMLQSKRTIDAMQAYRMLSDHDWELIKHPGAVL